MEMKVALPCVSVIIPIYNSEKYLDRCIDSICNQSYTNLEIILINDGSKDRCLSICKEFEIKDTRIKVVDISNGGVSNARNTGLKIATGDFIQFIDSDDFVDKEYVYHLYSVLMNTSAELSVCAIESFDNEENKLDDWRVEESVLQFDKIDKELFLNLIQKFLLFGPVNKLYKAEIIKNNTIVFDTSLSYGEDLLFNFEYFKHINLIAITDKIAYKYVHDNIDSLSKKKYKNKTALAKRIHKVLLDFFSKVGLTDKESLEVLYTRLFDYYYNEVYTLVDDTTYSFWEKKKKINILLLDMELAKSYGYLQKGKYANWIVFLMKYKTSLLFLITNIVLRKLKN